MWAFIIGFLMVGIVIMIAVAVLWVAWQIIGLVLSIILSLFSDKWG